MMMLIIRCGKQAAMDAQESALFAKLMEKKKAAVHNKAAAKKAKHSAKTPRCLLRTLQCALSAAARENSLLGTHSWVLIARGL
jgi:hypothetical protein